MNRHTTNALIVCVALLAHLGLSFRSGSTSVENGLGPDGSIYAARVVEGNAQRGTAVHRLTPAFTRAASVAYAVTGNIKSSFELVNLAAFLVLLSAACLILDVYAVPLSVKACAVLTIALLGLPVSTTAFAPGQPYLLGVALLTLAVAACEADTGPVILGVTHLAAVVASPVGIAGPLYGLWKTLHGQPNSQRRSAMTLLAVAPAAAIWLLVQVRARGGGRGFLEVFQLSRVSADLALWKESTFILLALYLLLTSLGGLTILLLSKPRLIREDVRSRPELLALVLPPLLFIATAGLDVPRMIPFLIPFWLIATGLWSRRHEHFPLTPILVAAALTLITQHPWVGMTDQNYFVDWFPYSVHAERVSVTAPDFDRIWRLRELAVIGGLAAFAAVRRRVPQRQPSVT
jgi:hypothetical protein